MKQRRRSFETTTSYNNHNLVYFNHTTKRHRSSYPPSFYPPSNTARHYQQVQGVQSERQPLTMMSPLIFPPFSNNNNISPSHKSLCQQHPEQQFLNSGWKLQRIGGYQNKDENYHLEVHDTSVEQQRKFQRIGEFQTKNENYHLLFNNNSAEQQSRKMPMAVAIQKRRYDCVRVNLQRNRNNHQADDPNEEIPFPTVYMTGLEYSIYKGDWKMAIVFFVHSADPYYNCFDGTILCQNGECQTHLAFLQSQQRLKSPIAGFPGLHCLLDSNKTDVAITKCTLWLMETSYSQLKMNKNNFLATIPNIRFARQCLMQIGAQTVWNTEFIHLVLTVFMCIHRSSDSQVANDVALNILEFVLDDMLLDVIWEGLRYVSDCAANP